MSTPEIDPEKLAKVNETNVFAPLRLSALFADALSESKGSIIMLNSCVSFSSQPEYAGYKLSKGALEHLASSLATELGPEIVRLVGSERLPADDAEAEDCARHCSGSVGCSSTARWIWPA